MGPTALSRRNLLSVAGVGAALLLSGCRRRSGDAPEVDATPTAEPDLELARRTARRVAALVGAITATAGRHRELRELLRPFEARHREQVRAFTPGGETARFPRPTDAPRTAAKALETLARIEQQAATATRSAALRASSGDLARALASAAACMAQHVAVLEAARDDQGGGS